MIAVQPLPGSPMYRGDDAQIITQALSDLHATPKQGSTRSFSKTVMTFHISNRRFLPALLKS